MLGLLDLEYETTAMRRNVLKDLLIGMISVGRIWLQLD